MTRRHIAWLIGIFVIGLVLATRNAPLRHAAPPGFMLLPSTLPAQPRPVVVAVVDLPARGRASPRNGENQGDSQGSRSGRRPVKAGGRGQSRYLRPTDQGRAGTGEQGASGSDRFQGASGSGASRGHRGGIGVRGHRGQTDLEFFVE